MQTIMSTPTQREIVWRRKMAQMDYNSAINSAEKIGEKIGEKRGEIKMLAELVKSNDLTLSRAAEKAQMTVAEFVKKAGIPVPQN